MRRRCGDLVRRIGLHPHGRTWPWRRLVGRGRRSQRAVVGHGLGSGARG
uniref:Uncharacterized protein n=1 Tax=Arundo donax TaxID=35708 RepID=A0A0A9AE68_ARUDO